jgi:hypothetical protein
VEHETHEASDAVFKEAFEQPKVHTLKAVSQVLKPKPVKVLFYLQRILNEAH